MEHLSNDELEAAKVTANVLESSAVIRARQQQIAENLARIAEKRAELEGSAEGALIGEMQLMADRMYELYDHHWWRRMGKSVLAVMKDEEHNYAHEVRLKTEPVPDGMIGVHEGVDLILSGVVYSTEHVEPLQIPGYKMIPTTKVYISRLIENQNLREASRTQKLYELRTYNDEIGRRVLPSGSEFRPLEEQKEREREEYREHLEKNRANMLGQPIKPGTTGRLTAMAMQSFEKSQGPITPPDDMFLKPLALVMQGNMLLGAKRK